MDPSSTRDEGRTGVVLGFAAYGMWGLFPLYWPLLEPTTAVAILAHRITWSLVVSVVLVALFPRARAVKDVRGKRLALLALGATVLAVNWGVYIYGVNSEQVVETSLGYFINPLVTVLLGVVVLGETLRRRQWYAVGLAAVAVLVLTLDYGRPPWIAITLACTFGTYGLVKKQANVGAIESLTIETGVLFLPAVLFLLVTGGFGEAADEGAGHVALLVGSGVITALPLLAFGAAATRVPLTTMGLLHFLTPTMQFLIGVTVRHEPIGATRLLGFALVWVALAIFTAEAMLHRRGQLRLTTEASAA